jgi:4-hydroxy-3-methylbut-2-en-1-yl diphosphate reductase
MTALIPDHPAPAPGITVRGPEPIDTTVLLAGPRSFCAGVERAIDIVHVALTRYPPPVYVRKQIVHNSHVVADLERAGATFVDELDEVPAGGTVIFSAHGVSPAVRAEADRKGLTVIDGTCPLVTKVHTEARRFADRGDTIILVGHAGHEESEGTLGEAPDRTVLVETVADAERLQVDGPVSYLTQTTLAADEAEEIVAVLRRRFARLRGPGSDDICYATTNRQQSLRVVAAEADVVLVIGSDNSSNSVRLVEIARREGVAAHLIDDVTDIDPQWIDNTRTVAVTAGASAPPELVEEVVRWLAERGRTEVIERIVAEETIRFALPKEVRGDDSQTAEPGGRDDGTQSDQ